MESFPRTLTISSTDDVELEVEDRGLEDISDIWTLQCNVLRTHVRIIFFLVESAISMQEKHCTRHVFDDSFTSTCARACRVYLA